MGNGASTNNNKRKNHLPDSLREPEESEDDFIFIESGYPSPRPPRNRKEDVFTPDGFTDCDERGYMAPIDVAYSWGTLIQYLVWGFRSQMDKLRTVFVWMGALDITHRVLPPIEGMDPETPYNDIRKVQQRKMSLAFFFLKLCRACDLKCVYIKGIAKSQAYTVGDPIDKMICLRNAWVAVYVEGDWRIIFPKWAFTPRHSAMREEQEEYISELPTTRLRKRGATINEFWFLTDPDKFVFFALPDDPKWQLLNVSFGVEKFVQIPYLYNPFFRNDMHICSAFKGKLQSQQGRTEIVIKSKNEAWGGLLMFELSTFDKYTNQTLSDFNQFTKYVIMCRTLATWTFVIRFPTQGTFLMRIKGGKSPKHLLKFCDFRIQCDSVPRKPLELPFEPSFIGWGPSLHTVKSGLINSTHKTGIIIAKTRFRTLIGFDLRTKEKIHVDLLNKTINPNELAGAVKFRCANNQLNIWVTVPHESEYALCIYIKKGSKADNVCNYFVTSMESKRKYIRESSKENPTETTARTNLKYATEVATSYKELDEAIEAFNKLSLEDDGDLTIAKDKRELLMLQAELREAMNRRFIKVLNPVIQKAVESKFATNNTIQRLIKEAQRIVKTLKKLEEFAHPVLQLSSSTIAEIHGYRQVTPEIEDVMTATFMLLGEKPEHLQEWDDIRFLMGKSGKKSLMFRIKSFSMSDLSEASACRVGSMLEKYNVKVIHSKSSGVAAFYVWSINIVQEKNTLLQSARQREDESLRTSRHKKGKR